MFFVLIINKVYSFVCKCRCVYLNKLLASNGSMGRITHLVDIRHPEHIFIGGELRKRRSTCCFKQCAHHDRK